MDDQSTISYVYPDVVGELGIEESDLLPTTENTITIDGISSKQCLKTGGLQIIPLVGETPISLKSALTNQLPNLIRDIPTPEEVSSIPGLSHLAPKFPIKKDWPTILLLGRDCMQAQTYNQVTWSSDKCQFAAKTPLGWVVVGKPDHFTRPLSTNLPKPPISTKNVALLQKERS